MQREFQKYTLLVLKKAIEMWATDLDRETQSLH